MHVFKEEKKLIQTYISSNNTLARAFYMQQSKNVILKDTVGSAKAHLSILLLRITGL